MKFNSITFAIPCFQGDNYPVSWLLPKCQEQIRQHHPEAEIVLLGPDLPQVTWCPDSSLPWNFQADWLKAQAYRLLQKPVWVLDMDILVQRPFPIIAETIRSLLPYHYPLIPAQEFNFRGMDYCSTIGCWYQATDCFDAYQDFFIGDTSHPRTERAAAYATLQVGGVIASEPIILVPHGGDAHCPTDPHAIHYASGLKDLHKDRFI